MKILALEREISGTQPGALAPDLKAEALRVWRLYQEGVIRELYFRQDRHEAVLILECADTAEARQVLDSLPLVKSSCIAFDVIPLIPYPGFERLFV
jgi:muconolactone delta-isomerase